MYVFLTLFEFKEESLVLRCLYTSMPAFTKSQSQECNKIQKISTKHKICFSFKTLFLCFTIISSNVEDLVFNIVDFASYIVWIFFVCLSTCIFIFNCHAFMNSLSLLIYNVNSVIRLQLWLVEHEGAAPLQPVRHQWYRRHHQGNQDLLSGFRIRIRDRE